MARDVTEKKKRVFFACEQRMIGATFFAALSKAQELDVDEFSGTPQDILKQAVAKAADLVILFFPEITDECEKCIRLIIGATYSHILLLTGDNVPNSISVKSGRLSVHRVLSLKNSIDDIVSQAISLGRIRSRNISVPPKNAVNPGHMQVSSNAVLAEGALAAKIVAVGASTGGTEALARMFHGLRPPMPGIVVVQHMPPVFTEMFAQRLDRELPFEVCEARDNTQIKMNSIHIAPGDRHLMIKKIGNAYFTVLGDTGKIGGHCPAVNVLFESVAKVAGTAATGVILTGMGSDGATGLLEMRCRGAFTIGQDEKSCVVYGMPRKAFEIGAVVRQAPLSDIAGILMSHLGTI